MIGEKRKSGEREREEEHSHPPLTYSINDAFILAGAL